MSNKHNSAEWSCPQCLQKLKIIQTCCILCGSDIKWAKSVKIKRRRKWRLPLKGNPPFMNRSRGLRTNSFSSRHQSQERSSRKLNLRVSPNKKHTSTEKENDIFVEFKRKHDPRMRHKLETTHLWRLFPFRIKFFFRLKKEIFYWRKRNETLKTPWFSRLGEYNNRCLREIYCTIFWVAFPRWSVAHDFKGDQEYNTLRGVRYNKNIASKRTNFVQGHLRSTSMFSLVASLKETELSSRP